MNIHLPAILGFTRYQGFDPSPYIYIYIWFWTPKVTQKVLLHPPWGSRSLSVQLRCEVRPPSGPSPRWVRLPQGQRSSSRGLHEKQRWHVVNQGWFMTFWYYMLLSLSIIYGFIRSYTLYYKKKKTSLGGASRCWFLSKKNLDRTSNENCWSKTGEFKDINETTPTSCKIGSWRLNQKQWDKAKQKCVGLQKDVANKKNGVDSTI